MATTINIADLTNGSEVNNEWQGTGVFDTLINAVNGNINMQYEQGRITATDYANVYLGSMQSVISQSLEYLLKHELIATQIDGEKANNAIKAVQLEEEQYKLNTLLPDEHDKSIEQLKEIKASAILKDKEAVKAGLDKLTKTISVNPEDVYTLKYGV